MFCAATVLKSLEGISSSLKEISKELFLHQQDLNTIKDDLGALKFGLAIVQDTTNTLSAYVSKIKYILGNFGVGGPVGPGLPAEGPGPAAEGPEL